MTSLRSHATCVVLAIGDELILGQTTDTNSAWISSLLADHGVRALRHVTVDDDVNRLAVAITEASRDADLVVLTGGLGPTKDDLTREALCVATGDSLIEDAAALAELLDWYGSRPMPSTNRVQAMRPSRARCIPNPLGSAPGLMLTHDGADVFAFPGPPSELKPMFTKHLLAAIRPTRVVRTSVLHTVGLGESNIAELLGELMDRDRNPTVGTTASGGIVSVRLRAESAEPQTIEDELVRTERAVTEALGPLIIRPPKSAESANERGIHAMVRELIGLLSDRGNTLSVCESCTAGLLAATIADVPGSSAVLVGGLVTYSNELKIKLAGVDLEVLNGRGAVSAQTAIAMAKGTRKRTAADHTLSITGIAGPGGGSEHKPVGTVWIALDSEGHDQPSARCFRFKQDRRAVRERSVVAALAMLRQRLKGLEGPLLGENS